MSVKCWLRAQRHDGNDPFEAMVTLSHRPFKGETIEIWDTNGGHKNFSTQVPCPVCRASVGEECTLVGEELKGEMVSPSGRIWHNTRTVRGGTERWVEVEQVVHCAHGDPEDNTLEVWVRMEGYDLKELEETMEAARRRDKP